MYSFMVLKVLGFFCFHVFFAKDDDLACPSLAIYLVQLEGRYY